MVINRIIGICLYYRDSETNGRKILRC